MKSIWFKRKIYGWGWTPSTWQGWLVTFIYSVLVIFLAFGIDDNPSSQNTMYSYFIPMILLTAVFIYIAYRTGEKPKWQWGKREK